MKIQQSGIFRRTVRKLRKDEKQALDKAVKAIVADPFLGKQKTGDLAGVQICKYKLKTQQYLLAYRVDNNELILTLQALGSHENFYCDLKRQ